MSMRDVRCGMWDVAKRGLIVAALAIPFASTDLEHLPSSVAAAQANDPAHQQFLFAYKLLQRGDDQLAGEAFDDYLGQFPRDAKRGDALYYRALLHRRAGQNERAAAALSDVPEPTLVPPHAVHLLRGQVLHDLGQHPRAVEALSRIEVSELEPQVAVSVLYLRGLAQRGAGNLAAAGAELRRAAELESPMRSRALLDLARVQVLMNHTEDALATLTRAIEAGEPAAAAEAARMAGDLSYNASEYDEAVGYYARVLEAYPSSKHFGPAVIGTLWSHFSAGRYPQVLEAFDRHRESLPIQERVPAWYLAGSAQQELGRHAEAAALFETISQTDAQYPLQEKVLYKLAASRFELDRFDEMSETIERLRTRYPQSDMLIDASFLLAAADAKRGNVERGAARLTEVVDQGRDHPYYLQALLRRGRLYEEHDQPEPASRDYLEYLKSSTYTTVGTGDGQPIYEPTRVQTGAFLRLLDVYQKLGSHGYAAGLAKQWLETMRLPALVEQEAMYRRALSLIQLDRPADALSLLEELGSRHPINPFTGEASYYRGLLLLTLERPDEATPLLERAAADEQLTAALRSNALRLMALRQRNNGQAEEAAANLRRLEAIASREQLRDEELIWLARHLLGREDAEAAWGYVRPLVESRPNASPMARAEAVYLAGRAQRALGNPDEATKLFEQVVAMGQGFDLESRLELARVAADRGQLDRALGELAGLINSESSPIAAEALFTSAGVQRRLAQEARRAGNPQKATEANSEARRWLKRLVLLYPFPQLEPLPQLAYVELAEIAAELGESQGTIHGELRELATKYPDGPYATYAKAIIAEDTGRRGDAVALLRSLRDQTIDERLASRVNGLLRALE